MALATSERDEAPISVHLWCSLWYWSSALLAIRCESSQMVLENPRRPAQSAPQQIRAWFHQPGSQLLRNSQIQNVLLCHHLHWRSCLRLCHCRLKTGQGWVENETWSQALQGYGSQGELRHYRENSLWSQVPVLPQQAIRRLQEIKNMVPSVLPQRC